MKRHFVTTYKTKDGFIRFQGLSMFFFCGLILSIVFSSEGFSSNYNDIRTGKRIDWSDNLSINEDLTVEENDTLFIDAGVTIYINNARLIVLGTLLAHGEVGQPVTFTSDHEKGWKGIFFRDCYTESEFKYCIFENTLPAISKQSYNEGLIKVSNSKRISITNSIIRNNAGGIVVLANSELDVSDTSFEGNQVYADNYGLVYGRDQSKIMIKDCIFQNNMLNNGGAIKVSRAKANLMNNKFIGNDFNPQSNIKNLVSAERSTLHIEYCTFKNNPGTNVHISETSNITIRESSFNGNINPATKAINIDRSSRVDIYLSSFTGYTNSAISSNISHLFIEKSDFSQCTSNTPGGAISFTGNLQLTDSLQITSSLFTENGSPEGGALYAKTYDAKVFGCHFTNSSAEANGGAIYMEIHGPALSLTSNQFSSNHAGQGGGALYIESEYAQKSAYELVQNRFYKNGSELDGGAAYFQTVNDIRIFDNYFEGNTSKQNGGAINSLNSRPIVENNIFNDNHTLSNGGALFTSFELNQSDSVWVFHNEFVMNTAGNGGAIATGKGILVLNDNGFFFNEAQENGGAMFFDHTVLQVNNNNIGKNKAGRDGGGISLQETEGFIGYNYIRHNEAKESGGGIGIYLCSVGLSLKENVIRQNKSEVSGAGIAVSNSTEVLLTRNLINFNDPPSNIDNHKGGGMHIHESSVLLRNVIIASNSASKQLGGGLFIENTNDQDSVVMINTNIVFNQNAGVVVDEHNNGLVWANNTIIHHNDPSPWINHNPSTQNRISYSVVPSGIIGRVAVNNSNSLRDCPAGFYQHTFLLDTSSCAIDSGDPSEIFHDEFFPPSQGEPTNDIGATGGPYASDMSVIYNFAYNRFPTARFSYEILDEAKQEIKFTNESQVFDVTDYTYHWFFGDGNDSITTNKAPIIHTYNHSAEQYIARLVVKTTDGIDIFADTITLRITPDKALTPIGDTLISFDANTEIRTINYTAPELAFATSYEWEITPSDAYTFKDCDELRCPIEWIRPQGNQSRTASIRVRGWNGTTHYGEWSEPLDVVLMDATNTISPSANSIKIYPNPSQGIISLITQGLTSERGTLNIYDSFGRLMHNQEVTLQTGTNPGIDLSSLAKGIYILRFFADDTNHTQKIIIY